MTASQRQQKAEQPAATGRSTPQMVLQQSRPQPAAAEAVSQAELSSADRSLSYHSSAPVFNRIRILMVHAPRYSFQGQARLAADAGVSRSTISRLLNGRINPSFRLAQAITASLEQRLNKPLQPRDVFSPDGTYPTPSGCELAGCRGCMPEEAYDGRSRLKADYRNQRPGDWSLSSSAAPQVSHRQPQDGALQEVTQQARANPGKETV